MKPYYQDDQVHRRAIGGHQSAVMGTDTWLTPPDIIAALGPFDLDPCAAPDPRPWPTAATHYTLPVDGLAQPWFGRVWLNPPYSREAVRWLRKLADHGTGTALIFARTETAWFVESVWGRANAVLFLHGRIHFHHADGTRAGANAGAPSCLVAYGQADADRLRASRIAGTYVPLAQSPTGRVTLADAIDADLATNTTDDPRTVADARELLAEIMTNIKGGNSNE